MLCPVSALYPGPDSVLSISHFFHFLSSSSATCLPSQLHPVYNQPAAASPVIKLYSWFLYVFGIFFEFHIYILPSPSICLCLAAIFLKKQKDTGTEFILDTKQITEFIFPTKILGTIK